MSTSSLKLFFNWDIPITALLALLVIQSSAQAQQYWRTDVASAIWTGANWGSSAAGPFAATYTANADALFTADSTVTFATASIGNVSVAAGKTVTISPAGTATFGATGTGGLVRTFDIGDGATLTWQSQGITANSSAGLIKNGNGILDLGSLTWTTAMNGGFTLNAGTLIVVGNKSQGNGALNLNGGTLSTSGTRDYTPTNIVIGGNFALAGTGNQNWDAATTIDLGAVTRAITNTTTSGSRQFRGMISGNTGAGLIFNGNGGAQIYIGNSANTFSGPLAINGAEVVFNGNGALGAGTAITIDGGRLAIGSMNAAGNTSAITNTIDPAKNIFVGDTAGTTISVLSSGGLTSYHGVVADAPGKIGILVKQGAGTLRLGGVNTYSGGTFANNGTLQLTNGNNRLPVSTIINLGQAANANVGTLDLNGCNQQIAGLNSITGINTTTNKNTLTSSTTAATLTVAGSGSYVYGDGTTNNSGVITGPVTLVINSSGSQTLGSTNTYTGNTLIQQGTLALGTNGAIASSPLIEIAGGTTLDISAPVSGLTLNSSQTLKASGSASTGTIATGAHSGLTLSAVSGLIFSAFTGTTAPLTLSGSGTMTLAGGNVVAITNSSGSPFAAGNYKLIAKGAGGSVGGVAPTAVSVQGNGIIGGGTSSLIISNAELYLHVAGTIVNPATNSIFFSGTTATIGVKGMPTSQYVLLTTTNLTGAWQPIQTNTTDGGGTLNFTDTSATNSQQFYRTQQQP